MKILAFFPEEFSGRFAREYHVFRLAESLAANGCEVTLAGAPSAALSRAEQLHDFFGGSRSGNLQLTWRKRELALGPWRIRSGAWFFHQLDRLLVADPPDLVYTMHLKAAEHLIRRHPAVPLIFEAHEIFADSHPENSARHRNLSEMERRIYAHVWGVVAISQFLGESLKKRFQLRVPLHVQHDGIDAAMLLQLSEPSDPHELIYTGSLQPWKGVPIAVEAMRLLPDYHLTILGGAGKPLEQLRRNAPSNVTFLGQVTREALRPHLQKASLGLMPNLPEPRSALYTFPLKLLEYSAAGKGIVASQIPVFHDLELGAWVSLIPPGSPEALAQGIQARAQQGFDRASAQAWAGQFLWQNQGATLKRFLKSVLTKP